MLDVDRWRRNKSGGSEGYGDYGDDDDGDDDVGGDGGGGGDDDKEAGGNVRNGKWRWSDGDVLLWWLLAHAAVQDSTVEAQTTGKGQEGS
ncbi:hypothetical protein TWF281_009610 [Arthrobotrys megalospora]